MAYVTDELISVWESGQYIGANTPNGVVQVQRGYWDRAWRTWTGSRVRARIWSEGGWGGSTDDPPHDGYWFPQWVSTSDWVTLDGVSSIKITKDFRDQRDGAPASGSGMAVAEVTLGAVDFVEETGALGDAYQKIVPGGLVATRGYVAPTRPNPGWATTGWEGVITDSVKIRIWQGYGNPQTVDGNTPPTDGGTNGAWTYAGMVDDVIPDSGDSSGGSPNQITLTARSGKLLTDQHCFGWVKSKRLPDPITFINGLDATSLRMVASGAAASSSDSAHQPAMAIDLPRNPYDPHDDASVTYWQSGTNISSSNLEWLDIRLPQGTYDEFWLRSLVGMTGYVGIFAHSIVHWEQDPTTGGKGLVERVFPPRMDGANITPGWVDLSVGTAPGSNGGWPYLRSFTTGVGATPGLDRVHLIDDTSGLQHSFDLGERSILRLGLTNSSAVKAKVYDMHGLKRELVDSIINQRYILVDGDVSDIVRVVLRWAGYTEWDVEDSGVKMTGKLVFNRGSYLIDIIDQVAKALGWIFFIADPTDANSNGVPTFRRDASLLRDNSYVAADLRDTGRLVHAQPAHGDESKPFIIRVRGKTAPWQNGGLQLGGDKVDRIMAVYVPPWAPGDRTGGIVRHVVHQDDQLITYAQCLYACFMIAMAAGLAMHTATVDLPAHPVIEVDDQVAVLDETTGTNSRLWVTGSTSDMTLGETGGQFAWKQTLTGALIDTQDLAEVVAECLAVDWAHVSDPTRPTDDPTSAPAPVLLGITRIGRTR